MEKKRQIVYACSGASNVGQTANSVGLYLNTTAGIPMSCAAALGAGLDTFLKKAADVDENIIIDGCPVGCLKTICEQQGIPNVRRFVVTELGIEKEYGRPVSDKDIQMVVAAILGQDNL